MLAIIVISHVYNFVWVSWLVLFLIFEFSALYLGRKMHQEGGTLSEFTWRLIRSHTIIFVLFSIFWGWLTLHFFLSIP